MMDAGTMNLNELRAHLDDARAEMIEAQGVVNHPAGLYLLVARQQAYLLLLGELMQRMMDCGRDS